MRVLGALTLVWCLLHSGCCAQDVPACVHASPSGVGLKTISVVTLTLTGDCLLSLDTPSATAQHFRVVIANSVRNALAVRQTNDTLEIDVMPPSQSTPIVTSLRLLQSGVSVVFLPHSFTYYGLFAVDKATIQANNGTEVIMAGRDLPAIKPSLNLRLALKDNLVSRTYPLIIRSYTETQVFHGCYWIVIPLPRGTNRFRQHRFERRSYRPLQPRSLPCKLK